MGAWGEELYENDNALDCLGDVIDGLVDSINNWFDNWEKEGETYDNAFEGNIGPLINILRLLCEHCPACPPEINEIEKWKKDFFKVYDKNAEIEWGKESAEYRRKIFKKEFDKLIKISKKYDEDTS